MIFRASGLVTLLALGASASVPPQPRAPCTLSVIEDTISFFSHGAVAVSRQVTNASACAAQCATMSTCQAWLYSTSGQECQQYREQPVSKDYNPLFVSGSCQRPAAVSPVSSIAVPSASSGTPTPSLFATPRPAESSAAVIKREPTSHHHHKHRHGHSPH
ncbi:hypothetical protein BO99DRAFT_51516 [Aspergillus violaceofuscus CBS 115571]|uniref:Apple domain-containing protein n=1 Tax=Aspergillus violaceofuscus (strain CBS 115571) TaxID=1450538 RepID=A0A2V5HBT7_ASPV1|nr:hypothetical protein BO99DRAFT_51516 [Aspergillus violaceofuscus CBS 115571]